MQGLFSLFDQKSLILVAIKKRLTFFNDIIQIFLK